MDPEIGGGAPAGGRPGGLGRQGLRAGGTSVQFKANMAARKQTFQALFKLCVHAQMLQSCPALCDPMDCRLPGSSIPGILQVRLLEWVAISPSRGSSPPRDQTRVS